MKAIFILAFLVSTACPVLAADYDRTEKTPLYEIRLRVPSDAMAIAAVKNAIMTRYNADAGMAKADAKEDKAGNPSFQPYAIDTDWRITFENDAVISLSADTYADTGGAHPNDAFQTLVWDKKANRAVAITDLFAPAQAKTALIAIAAAATSAWTKIYTGRSGQKPGANADLASDGIGPDAEKLKTYALTYAKGQTSANGIVLLYGAGQVWPHVLGDFRLVVPIAIFRPYLAPQWKSIFASAQKP